MALLGVPRLQSWSDDGEAVYGAVGGMLVVCKRTSRRRTYSQDATEPTDTMVSSPPVGFILKSRGGTTESIRCYHLAIEYVDEGAWVVTPVTPLASPSASASP